MSVTIRPYRRGGWEVDIRFRLPNGLRHRERYRAPVSSKSAAQRWGEDRERHLVQHGVPEPKKEVPTLQDFSARFIDEHARANRQKPSGIAAKEMIIRVHLTPMLGHRQLDTIKTEDIQRLKAGLSHRSAKTVNNVVTVLNTMLKKAVEWSVVAEMPCAIKLLPVSKKSTAFYDFDEYERIVAAARIIDQRTYLVALLGGEAGLRCGEMIALEWADVDLGKRQLCVRHSDWNGQVTTPKGGRLRHVPMTVRLTAALREHRHLRSSRVLCQEDGRPLTRQMIQNRMRLAARRGHAQRHGVHILRHTFCSHLAMRGAPVTAIQELAGHKELGMTQRYMHLTPAALDAAIRLLDSPGIQSSRGDILETNENVERKTNV